MPLGEGAETIMEATVNISEVVDKVQRSGPQNHHQGRPCCCYRYGYRRLAKDGQPYRQSDRFP
jgi:hypothetical protein